MQTIRFRLKGETPLLQHNVRLANPLDPFAKQISAIAKKRNKTDADYAALAPLEFEGGMYFDKEIGPYVPGAWIDRMLENAGKREKLGSTFKAYAQCLADKIPIEYEGPRTLKGLWENGYYWTTMVGVQQRKTTRTRPMFQQWAIQVQIFYDEEALDAVQIIRTIERAGLAVGLGDYRPRYGKFVHEVLL